MINRLTRPLILGLLVLLSAPLFAANTITLSFAGIPTGHCAFVMYAINSSNGDFYDCLAGNWNKVTGATSSSVTSITGDGALITNVASSGGVTLLVGSANSHLFWGNHGATSATASFSTIGTSDVTPNTYATGGGTANAQTVTLSPAATALTAGLLVAWTPSNANTGATTLGVNALTAKNLTKCGTTALIANDLVTTSIAVAIYDGTEFQLQNPAAQGCTGNVSSGNTGFFAFYPSTGNTVSGGSHLDDGATTGGKITSTEPIVAPSFQGSASNGGVQGPEGTCAGLTPGSGVDTFCPSSASVNGWYINNSNVGNIRVKLEPVVNAQTGTTYNVVATDIDKLVTLSNASGVAVALPQATTTFGADWAATLLNQNSTGNVTITPTTSTINGASSLVLFPGQAIALVSDGTNWQGAVFGTIATSGARGSAGQIYTSGGASAAASFVDFPDVHYIPMANCNNTTPGSGPSLPATNSATPACRTGTNVNGGVLQFAATSTAQFQIGIPADWDSSSNPFMRIFLTQGANTTASQTIIMQAAIGCSSTTDDPSFASAQAFSTATTTATANTPFVETVSLNGTSMTNCVAGNLMNVKLSRGSDTSTTAPNIQEVSVTFPRKLVIQAN